MRHIFHITSGEAWQRQKKTGTYRHPSLDSEGFIHCSDERQIDTTWKRFFRGETGWVVLDIDVGRLKSQVRYEKGEPNDTFPHVYGPVNVDAVVEIRDLPET